MRRIVLALTLLLLSTLGAAAQWLPLVSNGTPSYYGQVATRSRLPNGLSTIAGDSQMSKSLHILPFGTSGPLAIDIPTYVIPHSTLQEYPLGGPMQFRASIEYPPGTCTQLGYLGSGPNVSALPSSGSTALQTAPNNSDNWWGVSSFTAPVGAVVGVRIYGTGGPGVISYGPSNAGSFVAYQGGEDYINGERYRASSSGSTSDQTTTCDAITDEATGRNVGEVGFGPTAIVSPTTHPAFYCWGDSRVEAVEDWYNDSSTNIGNCGRVIGPYFPYINGGIAGLFAATWLTSANTHQIALSKYTSHLMSESGYNDMQGGQLPATVVTSVQSAWVKFGATRVLVATVEPETASSDHWQTTTNQTVGAYNSNLLAYNTLVRAGLSGAIGYVDLASVATGSVGGSDWIISTITAFYTATCSFPTLTVSAITSGALAPLDGTNGPAAAGSIFNQLTGTTGGTGTYTVSNLNGCPGTSGTSASNAATCDGIHACGPKMNGLYNTSGVFNHAAITYP
jgi:hypothetical protein